MSTSLLRSLKLECHPLRHSNLADNNPPTVSALSQRLDLLRKKNGVQATLTGRKATTGPTATTPKTPTSRRGRAPAAKPTANSKKGVQTSASANSDDEDDDELHIKTRDSPSPIPDLKEVLKTPSKINAKSNTTLFSARPSLSGDLLPSSPSPHKAAGAKRSRPSDDDDSNLTMKERGLLHKQRKFVS